MLVAKIAPDAPISEDNTKENEARPIVFKGNPVK